MKPFTKALAGTLAAGAMAMTAAAPASARDYNHRDRDGISAGEVIAGVAILGGIAAIAASASSSSDRYDSRYYRDGRYGYYNGSPRDAVAQCVNAVRMDAGRYGYANVTQIRDVDDTRNGWKVKGRLEVNSDRGYYNRRGYYDNGYYGYYDRGRYSRPDSGSFTCYIDRGRVAGIDYHGIRGL